MQETSGWLGILTGVLILCTIVLCEYLEKILKRLPELPPK